METKLILLRSVIIIICLYSSHTSKLNNYVEKLILAVENNCYRSYCRNITQHIRPTGRDVAELNSTFGEFALTNSDSEGNNPDRP